MMTNPLTSNSRFNPQRFGSALSLLLIGLALLSAAGVTLYFLAKGRSQIVSIEPIMASAEKGQFVSQVFGSG